MRHIVKLLLLILALSGVADARKGYPVGIGPPRNPRLIVATSSASPLVDWASKTINRDGSSQLVLSYTRSDGTQVGQRVIRCDAACTVAIDQFGTIVAQPPPASWCSSIANEVTQTNSLVSMAAAAGKLNL